MNKRFVLASRKSDLARIQAYTVGEALKDLDPSIQIEYVWSSSWGDRRGDVDLSSLGGKGVFTQDLHWQLIKGDVDFVVHSWKDLPIEPSPGAEVIATLPREDMRDVLIIPKKHLDVIKNEGLLKVLTSSPRREYNLKSLIPRIWPHQLSQVIFQPIRGNVPTRFHKLFGGEEGQALVVAKAALDRILSFQREEFEKTRQTLRQFLKEAQWMILPLCENPCAPAQGALAIEVSQNQNLPRKEFLKERLKELNCERTYWMVSQERQILANYGGGCHQKIGVSVLERGYGQIHSIRGLTESGEKLKTWKLSREISFYQKVSAYDPRKNQWFERVPLPLNHTSFDRPLWVAKEMALPPHSICHHEIWASGVRTWEKLAGRGYWVNGCAESLGEREEPGWENLSGDLNWLKLTHSGAVNHQIHTGNKEAIATYQLKPLAQKPLLGDATHFYWMSGSQFREAIKCYPQLKNAHHSCGPGHTYESICEALGVPPVWSSPSGGSASQGPTRSRLMSGDPGHVDIFLSLEEWEEALGKAPQ